MDISHILTELEAARTERVWKSYTRAATGFSVIGTPTQAMKPIAKRLGRNQVLAEALFFSGCYDAMYLAGMVADPHAMTVEHFEKWHEVSAHPMVLDWIVAVSLAEMPFGISLAEEWILSEEPDKQATGWYAYCCMLGCRHDREFSKNRVAALLDRVKRKWQNNDTRLAQNMTYFVVCVGVSYLPLHDNALEIADFPGLENARAQILKAKEKGRLGFKRRAVRC